MSTALAVEQYLSPEEYLAFERESLEKHEYLAGLIYAMAGTSVAHERIASNIIASLRQQLRGKPCEVFSSNIKVRIKSPPTETYYYPDARVDCSDPAGESFYSEQPRVVFEVLSPATQRIDRWEKRLNYQTLSSLDVYVLVEQKSVEVIVYRRAETGWDTETLTDLSATLALPTIDCALPLSAIYERTELLRGSAAA